MRGPSLQGLPALRAVAVQSVAVLRQLVVVGLGDLRLLDLDQLAFELHDLGAAQADQMIVVVPLEFVERDAVPEVMRVSKPGVAEKLECAIDRCGADFGMRLAHPLVKLFARDVALRFEKGVENRLSLPSLLEPVAQQILGETFVGEFSRFGRGLHALSDAICGSRACQRKDAVRPDGRTAS